jgi:hypothetical protein
MENKFFGNNHSISLAEAKRMTKKFRDQKDNIVKDEHKGKHLIPFCESFDRAPFEKLLQREDCKGVRIYYGMKDSDQRLHAIIVGIDSQGNDILPIEGTVMDGLEPIIIEDGKTCPEFCPTGAGLNG